jgi:urease accessory protein
MAVETQPITVTNIVADVREAPVGERIHALEHDHRLETLFLDHEEMGRRRLRSNTDHGTECCIALPREQRLFDGAVLLLEDTRAVVVRQASDTWLSLRAADTASALELGYFAGNMHWRVRFSGPVLHIASEGGLEDMLARLQPLLDSGTISLADP